MLIDTLIKQARNRNNILLIMFFTIIKFNFWFMNFNSRLGLSLLSKYIEIN